MIFLQRQVDSRNMFLGEGGRGYGSWARVNSWGTGAVAASAVLEVTKETMKKKTLSIIDEFLIAKDMKVSKRGSHCFRIVVVFQWHAPSLSVVCLVWLVAYLLRELLQEWSSGQRAV